MGKIKKVKKSQSSNSNRTNSCTLYVDGMHCASCEILIEKKLLKQDGIKAVDASLKNSQIQINYTGSERPDIDQLNEDFKELGYNFSETEFEKSSTPVFSIRDGKLILNTEKINFFSKVAGVILILMVIFYFFEKRQFAQYVSVDSNSSVPAFFLLGVVAGLSSCAALIGGLLLSMIKQWNELYIDADSTVEKAQPHFMFHVGRILSFTFFGGILGLIGETISLNNSTVFSILTIIISLIMLIMGLQMLGFEWAQGFKITAPKWLLSFATDETNFKGKNMPFVIGGLTFFLPCGFTLSAQTAALASGSMLRGGLVMLLFALGTLPTLLAISYSGLAFNKKPHLTAKFNIIAGIVIIFFVIYNINAQMNVLGVKSLNDVSIRKENTLEEAVKVDDDGIQRVNIIAKGFQYTPTSSTTLKAGVPAKLVVKNEGIQGCGAFIAARGLFDSYVSLTTGITEIDLGKPKLGSYKLTCSMGMVPPITITVI